MFAPTSRLDLIVSKQEFRRILPLKKYIYICASTNPSVFAPFPNFTLDEDGARDRPEWHDFNVNYRTFRAFSLRES